MASRLLDRLRRSLFRDGQGAGPEEQQEEEQPEAEEQQAPPREERWEAELEEEEECVTELLGGTLCFDGGGAGGVDGAEGEDSGPDSDSDFMGESMEDGLSSTDMSPVSPSQSSLLTRQIQESWWSLRGLGGVNPAPSVRRQTEFLLFEVTDANVVQDGSSKYVLYTVHVIQSGGSDKTPAIITRRYSDFQRLHATLRRHHGDQMERVCFPRKKLRRNFTAETIAKRSRAFEQYLSHLCALPVLRGALCVRHFFYLSDLQTAQLLIRVGSYQDALGPLLNAMRLQQKMGWACYYDNQSQTPPTSSSFSWHWFFTLVGLSFCFQEVEQLEEARDHCDHALHVLTPTPAHTMGSEDRPLPSASDGRPHPLLLPLLQLVVRLSWQTGQDKRQWEELLQQLEGQGAGLDNHPTVKEFLIKHDLQEGDD
ncbi:unnamed protein product [Ophioblennius macclurei]